MLTTSMQKKPGKVLEDRIQESIMSVVLNDTLLLGIVFESFRDKCREIYELDPAYFLLVPGLVREKCLKKIKLKLGLLTDVDMLLMVEKGIRGGMFYDIYRYAKANNKYMKDYNSSKKSSYLMYCDFNNLWG